MSEEMKYSVELNQPLSVGNYILMFLLMAVPIVNIVLLLMWSFGSNVNRNKKNCALALLIMMVISIVLSVLLGGVLAAILASVFESMA